MAIDEGVTIDAGAEGRMSLREHISELRTRVMIAVAAIAVGTVICWIFYSTIKGWFENPLCDVLEARGQLAIGEECALNVLDPLDSLTVRFKVAGYGGIALAMPVILWQIWQFIMPGLYPHEKRYSIPFVFFGALLFVTGAALGFWVIPRGLDFLIGIGGFNAEFTADRYFRFVTSMMLAFGIGFQFPIVLIFLQLTGLLSHKSLVKARRFAIVGIVILAAVISPTGDPISLMVLSVPLYIFYEISIIFGWARMRNKPADPLDA